MKINKNKLELFSTTEILNLISNYYGNSILEKMLDFCETNDIEEQFLGDILSEDKEFKELLHNDCFMSNAVKDNILHLKDNRTECLNIW